MEMLFLSNVNELCIYLRLCLSSGWFHLSLRINNISTVYFTHGNVLLSYVNETVYLLGNLPFFKIHANHFMARDDSLGANIISKCILWVSGLVPFSEFWDISFL